MNHATRNTRRNRRAARARGESGRWEAMPLFRKGTVYAVTLDYGKTWRAWP